ncbi:MAG TPA: serine hydrolase [Terriglobales bacterium]|nr:serine hydrolase [Terriglobales bacterium]
MNTTIRGLVLALSFTAGIQATWAQTSASCCPQTPTKEKQQALWQKLEDRIAEVDRHLDGSMGVAIRDLADDKTFLLHGDDIFAQASSIKIAVLAELFAQEQRGRRGEQGVARLNDLYTVRSEDMVPDSFIMLGLTPGVTRVTNRDLATMMVAVSDNSATNVLIDHVGMANVERMLAALGLRNTHLQRKMMDIEAARQGRENVSTPREMMTLLQAIYRNKLLDKELTADFFKALSIPKDSSIPKLLPAGLVIANKPGELEAVRNDSGIVFVPSRPFVICVMTSYLRDERLGQQAISEIALAAYEYFDRMGKSSEYGRAVPQPTK